MSASVENVVLTGDVRLSCQLDMRTVSGAACLSCGRSDASWTLWRGTMTIKIALWLLPVGFVLHDGEELLTMVDWIARHQEELDAMVVARFSAAAPRRERAVHTY